MFHRSFSVNKGTFANLTAASFLAVLRKPAEPHGLRYGKGSAHTQFLLFLVSLPFGFMRIGMPQRNLSPFALFILVIEKILKHFAVT